jgi:GntR family transcriptional regulator, transcriptional repressor for pyruvate dehydrogenase complex
MALRIVKPRRADLTRQCVDSIQEYIDVHSLHPGDRLPSLHEWTDLLGVSILVVREAFRALQALGLVDIQHGRGVYLSSPEETDFLDYLAFRHSLDRFTLEEVIEGRAMLELTVLEVCIARADDTAIAELEAVLQDMRRDPPLAGEDSPDHKRFHQAMLRASGDRLLRSIGMPLLNTYWVLGNSGKIALPEDVRGFDMLSCHAAYLDAIKRRDFSQTRELVDKHLFGLCSRLGIFPFAHLVKSEGVTP